MQSNDPDAKASNENAPPQNVRRRGRKRNQKIEKTINQVESKQPVNPFKTVDILPEEKIEEIENASFDILENYGIEIKGDQTADIMRKYGADVSSDNKYVRMDRNLIREAIKTCPSQFTIHSRNSKNNIIVGGKYFYCSMVGSPPNVSDTDKGRRPGNWHDFVNILKIAQKMNICHAIAGHPVEPIDVHASIRHLESGRAFATITDKIFACYSLNRQMNLDSIEIARIVQNIDQETMCSRPSLTTVVNSNSPLKYDKPMLEGIIEMAKHNQVTVVTPFTLLGAMAPITKAGGIALQNAEALAGIALSQMVRKGAPVIYGGFTSNVDMKSGSPAFGTPEYVQCTLVGGQMARRYNLPYRSSNTNSSNLVDAQATYESQMSIWACMLGGVNMMKHAFGWLEGGLVASYEKIALDMEMLQQIYRICDGFEVSPETLALDAVKEAGHGGHFFGTKHTRERYKDAFYTPLLSDWSNFENWNLAGAKTTTQRANQLWKTLLEQYEKPPIEKHIEEELDEFIEKRKEQGGIASDF